MTSVDFPDWTSSARSVGAGYVQNFGVLGVGAGLTAPSGFIYVGNFDTVILQHYQNVAQNAQWTLSWVDAESYLIASTWADGWHKNTTNTTYTAFSVKGPYIYLTVTNNGASFMNFGAFVYGAKGEASPGSAIMPQVLVTGTSVAVGANSVVDEPVATSICGPAALWGNMPVAGYVLVQAWNGSSWNYIGGASGAGAFDLTVPVILPSDDIRIQLGNSTAGASTASYALTHGG